MDRARKGLLKQILLEKKQRYNEDTLELLDHACKEMTNRHDIAEFVKDVKNAAVVFNDEKYLSPEKFNQILGNLSDLEITMLSEAVQQFNCYKNSTIEREDGSGEKIVVGEGIYDYIREVAGKVFTPKELSTCVIPYEKVNQFFHLSELYVGLATKYLESPRLAPNGKVHRPADKIVSRLSGTYGLLDQFTTGSAVENSFDVIETLQDARILGDNVGSDLLRSIHNEDIVEGNAFTKVETEKLLNKNLSILLTSDANKIKVAQSVLLCLSGVLRSMAQGDEEFVQLVDENINLKKLALKSASFLGASSDSLLETFELLIGRIVKDSVSADTASSKKYKANERYADMRISTNELSVYHLVTQTPFILSELNSNKMFTIGKYFDEVIDNVFTDEKGNKLLSTSQNFKRSDFDVNTFLTGNNIATMMYLASNVKTPESEAGKARQAENIKFLSSIMDGKNVFKIMKNNMSIINMDSNMLKLDIEELFNRYGQDNDLLSNKINEYLQVRHSLNPTSTRKMRTEHSDNIDMTGVSTSINDIDNPYSNFHIKLGHWLTKKPTISQVIAGLDFDGCIEMLNGYLDRLDEYTMLGGEDDNMVALDNNVSAIRLAIINSKKVIARAEEIINGCENVELVDNQRTQLNKIRNAFSILAVKCKGMLGGDPYNNSYMDFVRGKRVHKQVNPKEIEGTLSYFLEKARAEAEKIRHIGDKESVMRTLDNIDGNQYDMHNENFAANKDRIDRYDYAMYFADNYANLRVAADEIEDRIIGE